MHVSVGSIGYIPQVLSGNDLEAEAWSSEGILLHFGYLEAQRT